MVRTPTADSIGPFTSRADAVDVADTVAEFSRLRTCTKRLGRGAVHGPDCPARELGACPASWTPEINAEDYAAAPEAVRGFFRGTNDAPLQQMQARIDELISTTLPAVHKAVQEEYARAVDQFAAGHAFAVQVGSVQRVEVADGKRRARPNDFCVTARDCDVVEEDIGLGVSTSDGRF